MFTFGSISSLPDDLVDLFEEEDENGEGAVDAASAADNAAEVDVVQLREQEKLRKKERKRELARARQQAMDDREARVAAQRAREAEEKKRAKKKMNRLRACAQGADPPGTEQMKADIDTVCNPDLLLDTNNGNDEDHSVFDHAPDSDALQALIALANGSQWAEFGVQLHELAEKIRAHADSNTTSGSSHSSTRNASHGNNDPWTTEELSRLAKATVKFGVGTSGRWELVATAVGGGRSAKQCVKKAAEVASQPVIDRVLQKIDSSDAQVATAPPDDVWTPENQAKLERALLAHPASMGKQRWSNIARDVGLSRKLCVDRYKFCVQIIKKNST